MSLVDFPQDVNGETHNPSTASEIGHNGGPPLIDDAFPKRGGFVAVTREMRDHPLVGFGSAGFHTKAEAWIDLIMECKYKAGVVNNGGRPMLIKPGQLVGAVSWLANRWNWTPKEVRYFLDRLVEEGMIERFTPGTDTENSFPSVEQSMSVRGQNRGQQKGKQAQVISVCNYEIYQFMNRIARQANRQEAGKQGASEGQARGNNYNKETIKQDSVVPSVAGASKKVADSRDAVASAKAICDKLLVDNYPFLDGKLHYRLNEIGPITTWIDFGADPEIDIFPVVKAKCTAMHGQGKPVMSWEFFTEIIRDSLVKRKRVRETGQPEFAPRPSQRHQTQDRRAQVLDDMLTPEQKNQVARIVAGKRGANV